VAKEIFNLICVNSSSSFISPSGKNNSFQPKAPQNSAQRSLCLQVDEAINRKKTFRTSWLSEWDGSVGGETERVAMEDAMACSEGVMADDGAARSEGPLRAFFVAIRRCRLGVLPLK
jgi:hypothetical protein